MPCLSRRLVLAALVPVAGFACCGALSAAENAPGGKRVALSGYDPISYFADGRPEQGSHDFNFAFDDTVYWFKNAEHRAMFVKDPERYAPQFSGFCAATVAIGDRHEADPEAWVISDDKLYVFGSKSGAARFKQAPGAYVNKANASWQAMNKPN